MKINVYSLAETINLIKSDEAGAKRNWVSIRDIGHDELYEDISNICENLCIIEFDDITCYNVLHNLLHPYFKKTLSNRNLVYFNETLANRIFEFAKNVFDSGEELNIHCYAGKSRSQAIGYVLNQYFNLYLESNLIDFERNIKENNSNFMGNSDVIKVMNKVMIEKWSVI
jgi:predicted protein tyrosine phosphatase